MRELIIYPNASKGGIASVIRGRATAQPHVRFDTLFFQNRGGKEAFSDLPNVKTTIIPRGRAESAAKYLNERNSYETVSILSAPTMVKHLAGVDAHLRYEFHSSDMSVNKHEIETLDMAQVDEVSVPSEFMATTLRALLPKPHRRKLTVRPNLVDTHTFRPDGPNDFYNTEIASSSNRIPLIWVGRFDEGKGYRHFLRALAMLPSYYYGIVVVSLESDPSRASSFLNECFVMGVSDRVELYLNQPQAEMAKLYRWAASQEGLAISTSLLESFGYFVAEATACNLPVVAFDLPVWEEHVNKELITSVPIGSVTALTKQILEQQTSTSGISSPAL